MREGQRLKQLLDRAGMDANDLAAAMEVSRAMAYKYFKISEFKPAMYRRICDALENFGIDHTQLRTVTDGTIEGELEDLRPYIHGLTDKQLESLAHILKSSTKSRQSLLMIVEVILARHSHH